MTILIIPPISNYCSPLARQCLSHTGSERPICESIFLIIHNSSRGSVCSAFLSTKPSLLVTKLESAEWTCRCDWGLNSLFCLCFCQRLCLCQCICFSSVFVFVVLFLLAQSGLCRWSSQLLIIPLFLHLSYQCLFTNVLVFVRFSVPVQSDQCRWSSQLLILPSGATLARFFVRLHFNPKNHIRFLCSRIKCDIFCA